MCAVQTFSCILSIFFRNSGTGAHCMPAGNNFGGERGSSARWTLSKHRFACSSSTNGACARHEHLSGRCRKCQRFRTADERCVRFRARLVTVAMLNPREDTLSFFSAHFNIGFLVRYRDFDVKSVSCRGPAPNPRLQGSRFSFVLRIGLPNPPPVAVTPKLNAKATVQQDALRIKFSHQSYGSFPQHSNDNAEPVQRRLSFLLA